MATPSSSIRIHQYVMHQFSPIYQTSSSLKSVELPQELGQYLLVGISMSYLVSLFPPSPHSSNLSNRNHVQG